MSAESLDSLLADLDTIANIAQAGVLSRTERQLEPGETRPAAVLFIDVVGFTDLARRLSSEQLSALIDRSFRIFDITVKAHGGYCDKVIGDAALYVFAGHPNYPPPVPSALAAGLKLLERARQVSDSLAATGLSINVRGGVSFGEVTRQRVGGEDQQLTVMGDTVNIAQRLENSARPGTVQTTIRVLDKSGEAFDTEPAGQLDLKGFGQVNVFRVTGQRQQAVQLRGGGRLSPLTGRDGVMAVAEAQLEQWLSEPASPPARLMLFSGVAAVGKSRLAYEMARLLEERQPSLCGATAHCTENTPPNVFTAELAAVAGLNAENLPERWESLCRLAEQHGPPAGGTDFDAADYAARARRHLPLLAWVLGCRAVDTSGIRQADPASFLLGCRLALCACCELACLEAQHAAQSGGSAPVVLVIEDLQWLGELDGLLRGLLTNVCLPLPLIVIATARPEYLAEAGRLGALFAMGQGDDSSAVPWACFELEPLKNNDGEALLQALLPGLVLPAEIEQELHEKASGLPYYYEEFARMLLRRRIVEQQEDGNYALVQELSELALPEDIQALLLGRLDMLPQDLKELTMRASVLGRSFDRDLLARVQELLELHENRPLDEQLEELVRERVLLREEAEV